MRLATTNVAKLLARAASRTAANTRALSTTMPASNAKFRVKTYNAISPEGLAKYPAEIYDVSGDDSFAEPHAIMLRSHKLQESEVPDTVRAIARCGAGVNNIPVDRMTALGVPVFNTPGANANAVKELVLCALFLTSRGIVDGVQHMRQLHKEGTAKERVEKDKKMFGGQEIAGKTLGVVGLGHIGASVAEAAMALGMNIVGYDPVLSVEAAWRLPGEKITRAESIPNLVAQSDYVSIHVPFIPGVTEDLIGDEVLLHMRPHTNLLNFSRGEIVDSKALRAWLDAGATGKYICDFPDDDLHDHPNVQLVPHLGASTEEAEANAAAMAADTIRDYIETGSVRNSVNFPEIKLEARDDAVARVCIVTRNEPGMLGAIMTLLGDAGINVLQHSNASKGDVAYNVVDMAKPSKDKAGPGDALTFKSWQALQDALTGIQGVLSTRILEGSRGAYYSHGELYYAQLKRTISREVSSRA